jgi:hypothetical protein
MAAGGALAVAPIMLLAATGWFWLVQAVWVRHRMHASISVSALAATAILLAGAGVNYVIGTALTHVGHHVDTSSGAADQAEATVGEPED